MKKIKAFTLSRHAKQVRNDISRIQGDVTVVRRGFTLAEVLITLMVIGVVAVLTIPAMMTQINDKILENQRKTAGAKIAEGFSQMRAEGLLGENYTNTMEFVNAMKKYFKITSVCDKNNLANCFVANITVNEKEFAIPDNLEDANNTVGLKLSDGTNMLIKYNPEGTKIAEGDKGEYGTLGQFNKETGYANFGDLFQYEFDVNNSKGPNIAGKDVIGNFNFKAETSITDWANTECKGDTKSCYIQGESDGYEWRDVYDNNGVNVVSLYHDSTSPYCYYAVGGANTDSEIQRNISYCVALGYTKPGSGDAWYFKE